MKLGMIGDGGDTALARTVRAAVEDAVRLGPVSNDLTAAVIAAGGKLVDGAFEAVERVRRAVPHNLKGEIVIVPADVALGHGWFNPARFGVFRFGIRPGSPDPQT